MNRSRPGISAKDTPESWSELISGLYSADCLVRGFITCDPNEDGQLPLLMVDGLDIFLGGVRADGNEIGGLDEI